MSSLRPRLRAVTAVEPERETSMPEALSASCVRACASAIARSAACESERICRQEARAERCAGVSGRAAARAML
eukprot:6024589-Prymnesium_polylepis.1